MNVRARLKCEAFFFGQPDSLFVFEVKPLFIFWNYQIDMSSSLPDADTKARGVNDIEATPENCTLWKCTAFDYNGRVDAGVCCEQCKTSLTHGVFALDLLFCSIYCWGARWQNIHRNATLAPPTAEQWNAFNDTGSHVEDLNSAPFMVQAGGTVLAKEKKFSGHERAWENARVHHVSSDMYWCRETHAGPLFLVDGSGYARCCGQGEITVLDVLQVLSIGAGAGIDVRQDVISS